MKESNSSFTPTSANYIPAASHILFAALMEPIGRPQKKVLASFMAMRRSKLTLTFVQNLISNNIEEALKKKKRDSFTAKIIDSIAILDLHYEVRTLI